MIDTHYYYRPALLAAEPFKELVLDVARLIEAVAPNVCIRGFDGTGAPVVTDERIVFNGDAAAGYDHEPLIIEREFDGRLKDGVGFAFCKTNGKPYDVVVVAALYAFVSRFPEATFRTDSTRRELVQGFDLFRSICDPRTFDEVLFEHPLEKYCD